MLALASSACSDGDSEAAGEAGSSGTRAPAAMVEREPAMAGTSGSGSNAGGSRASTAADAGQSHASSGTAGSGHTEVEPSRDAAVERDAGRDAGGSGDSGSCDAGCSSSTELKPALLDIWYFGWTGGNSSFFQIGVCADGVATYLFARGPNDANPTRAQGGYVVLDSSRLKVEFPGAMAPPGAPPPDAELEYEPSLDRLHYLGPESGYDSYGMRFSEFQWSEPAATCP